MITQSNSIYSSFRRAVSKNKSKLAISFEGRDWTFQSLELGIGRICNYLSDKGFNKGDRIISFGKNSDTYIMFWLACVKMGCIHIPVNYSLTEKELRFIIDNSGACGIFCDEEYLEKISSIAGKVALKYYGLLNSRSQDSQSLINVAKAYSNEYFDEVESNENTLAQIIYTSGTTADPKGVMHTHRSLMSQYISTIIELDIKPNDKMLAALPLYHCAQLHNFSMPCLLMGGTNYILRTPVVSLCFDTVEQHGITSLFFPPSVWTTFLKEYDQQFSRLTTLVKAYYGASIMPQEVLSKITQLLPKVGFYNCYGQTEIAPLATVLRPEEHELRPSSVGKPVFNVETKLMTDDLKDVEVGCEGEIVHRSPQLLEGYWNNDLETSKAFEGDWFHSGDIGRFDSEGYLYIVDRKKDVINTGGVVVSSREVEEAIYHHENVHQVAVIGLSDTKWIEKICAVIVTKDAKHIDELSLNNFLKVTLAPHKIPKSYKYLDQLPTNPAGKILKRELRDMFEITD
ncbi:AMP-binding protein [Zhongshania aquimaris]|uniref:AMP-binding protein n=1 Tax=Zhongshania aquimaris TaxID=2857107 RepID=A0ABS6VV66_9GAMM|nr:AMP-binding protein [Zhongshania aquimaris]MBW2942207.1 AMP-binding protein [Zhongshania aquimaris]